MSFSQTKEGEEEMKTYAEIHRAVMTLADADVRTLTKITEELWNESKTKPTPRGKKHFVIASDIAALVRDRLKEKKK